MLPAFVLCYGYHRICRVAHSHAFTGSTPHRFANEGRELGREYRDSGPGSHRKGNSARQGKSYKPAIDPHPPTFC